MRTSAGRGFAADMSENGKGTTTTSPRANWLVTGIPKPPPLRAEANQLQDWLHSKAKSRGETSSSVGGEAWLRRSNSIHARTAQGGAFSAAALNSSWILLPWF